MAYYFFFHGPLESFAFVYKRVRCFDHSICVLLFLEQYLLAQGRELFGWGYGPRACKCYSSGHHVNQSASGAAFFQFGKQVAFNGSRALILMNMVGNKLYYEL